MLGAAPGSRPLRGLRIADTEHWQESAVAQEIDGRALLGQDQRIAQRRDDGVHAKFDFLGAARQRGQRAQGLEIVVA